MDQDVSYGDFTYYEARRSHVAPGELRKFDRAPPAPRSLFGDSL